MAQSVSKPETDAEALIFNLYGQNQSPDISYQEFQEALFQFYQNPIDLNKASFEELQGLYLLTDKQITDLKAHQSNFGSLVSVNELQSIESFDIATIHSILPFITISTDEGTWRGLKKEIKKPHQHYLLFRNSIDIEKSKAFSTNAYIGDPNQIYVRYRIQKFKHFSFGITSEKDAGEAIKINPSQKALGLDYVSFHGFVYNRGRIKKWAIGDYQLQFGQGLILSGGFYIGKGAETILSTRRNSSGISPYTSSMETNYFRGSAITLDFKPFEITPFFSRKWIDAAIDTQDSTSDDDLAALRKTGLHRTKSELEARKTLLETDYGLNISYKSTSKNLQIGSTILQTEYDKFITHSDKLYNKFEFQGKGNTNLSAYYSYFWRNISLFGELGNSNGSGHGIVQGVLFTINSKFDFSILYRNFSPSLYTPHGNAFSENYKNSNEKGFYWGFKFKISPKTEITAYYDIFHFPWLKYQIPAPSTGHEYMINTSHKFNKKTLVNLQIRNETKEKGINSESVFEEPFLAFQTRKYAMFQFESKVDKHFYLKSRAQGSINEIASNRYSGFLLSQDLGYDGRKIDLSFRTALFDTDNFETRQYTYEKDVLYSFSFPFYYGKGVRNYIVAKFNLKRQFTFWIKYGRTTYFDRQTIGTGNDQISGNIKSEVKFQLRYSLL